MEGDATRMPNPFAITTTVQRFQALHAFPSIPMPPAPPSSSSTAAAASAAASAPAPAAPRTRHTRTRTGCLTCRSRKKKCDEARPRCAACRRNQLTCEWPRDLSSDSHGDDSQASSSTHHHHHHRRGHGHGHQLARRPRRQVLQTSTSGSGGGGGGGGGGSQPRREGGRGHDHGHGHHDPAASVSMLYSGDEERACGLTPQSVVLLGHYLCHTAHFFAMAALEDNPFISILLPLAYMDDLLMHGLLALSGTHLTYKEPGSAELVGATQMHYSRLITGLQDEIAALQEESGDVQVGSMERLLRVLLVACHYEAVSGNTEGAIFSHLRASHHLISSLISSKDASESWQARAVNHGALGFSIELYAYLTLCNTLIPTKGGFSPVSSETESTSSSSTTTTTTTIAVAPSSRKSTSAAAAAVGVGGTLLDPFVMSLEEMASFPTFGALFAGSHDLFQILAETSKLASRRLEEEAAGVVDPSGPLRIIHDELYSRVTAWEMPPLRPGENLGIREDKSRAAETLRQGLYIYLATSLAGSVVSDPDVRAAIRIHVITLFTYTPQVFASRYYFASTLWPVVVGATCIVKPVHQQALRQGMGYDTFSLRHLKVLGDMLQLLWDDPDPRAFGPYGLYLVMEKHGKTVGIV